MDLPNRDKHENALARALGKLNQEQLNRLMRDLGNPPTLDNLPPDYFAKMGIELSGVLQPALEEVFLEQVTALSAESTIGLDWERMNMRAAEWARRHSATLVKDISDNTAAALREKIAAFYEGGRTLGDLEASIATLMGPTRAMPIAITETTRAASQGERGYGDELRDLGLDVAVIWNTNVDEKVCPICRPRNRKRHGDGWQDDPPAHVNCRCWINTQVI